MPSYSRHYMKVWSDSCCGRFSSRECFPVPIKSPSVSFRDKINLYLSRIDQRFVGRSARSLVAEPTKVTATVLKQSDAEALDLCT